MNLEMFCTGCRAATIQQHADSKKPAVQEGFLLQATRLMQS
jgi:hypothetical protein